MRLRKQPRTVQGGRVAPVCACGCGIIAASSLLGAPRLALHAALTSSADSAARYGLDARIAAHPYLRMPATADGKIPPLLSQTGAFKDTRNLVPSDALIPYDLGVAFWSDGAQKLRWIAVPEGKIEFSPTGEWTFPAGTVFVKTFELPTDAQDPAVQRRLETRLLMVGPRRFRVRRRLQMAADSAMPTCCPTVSTEQIPIRDAGGETHEQTWYYPSRKDCLTCHTSLAGGVLGVKTRQMNHDFTYPSGVVGQRAANLEPSRAVRYAAACARHRAGFPRLAAATTPRAAWRIERAPTSMRIAPAATVPAAPSPISTPATTRRSRSRA